MPLAIIVGNKMSLLGITYRVVYNMTYDLETLGGSKSGSEIRLIYF